MKNRGLPVVLLVIGAPSSIETLAKSLIFH
jgi:hypothetical protein